MVSHTGTHMDGLLHYVPEGLGLHEMPLDAALGRAPVIEINYPESIKPDELQHHYIKTNCARTSASSAERIACFYSKH